MKLTIYRTLTLFLFLAQVQSVPLDLATKDANDFRRHSHWVDIWTAMPQLTEPYNLPPTPFNSSDTIFANTTIRQTFQVTQNADKIRLRLSNAFGIDDLAVSKVTIGLPLHQQAGISALEPGTMKELSFSGESGIIIPNGGLAVSDPIDFSINVQSNLMVSIYLEQGQTGGAITGHPGSRVTSWMSFGDWTDAGNLTDSSVTAVDHWYFLSALEGYLPQSVSGFAIIGDSITDGHGSDTNQNNRWPDLLLSKMQHHHSTSSIAILNQAAGGNRILHDGLGPNVISRVDRDVLSHSGVRYAMIWEGVNDIGVAAPDPETQKAIGDELIVAFKQIATRIHAAEIPIFGATISPFGTPPGSNVTQAYSDPEREKTRQRVNEWIRTSSVFDFVLDFDRVLRDPNDSSRLAPEYDLGDHLHPSVNGYRALVEYFPLDVFGHYKAW